MAVLWMVFVKNVPSNLNFSFLTSQLKIKGLGEKTMNVP